MAMKDEYKDRYEASSIFSDWRAGMSYDDLHRKYVPWAGCECDACEKARADGE